MIKLKDIDRALADMLLDTVINKKGNLTYKEVADELSKRLNREIKPHYTLTDPLINVSTLCFELGLPLISARVIYSNTNNQEIGKGFYQLACKFRPEYKTMTSSNAWKNELKLIRDCPHWNRLKEYLDGIPVDVILNKIDALPPSEDAVQIVQNKDKILPPESQEILFDPVFPDEVDTSIVIIKEGAFKTVNVNVRERNPIARQKCITFHGTICAVCDVDLGRIYGEEFSGKIHVHHLNPLSDYNDEHDVDPINDLRPVCPNCHMIIHCRQDNPYLIEEVKAFMNGVNRKA